MEVWKVEPVRDDSLERHVRLADHSAVGPSIVAASPHTGHRGIAVWPSQHQRDWVARNRLNPVLDPPDDLGVRSTGQLHHPWSVVRGQSPDQPVMQRDRLSGLIEGDTRGEVAEPCAWLEAPACSWRHRRTRNPTPTLVHTWSTLDLSPSVSSGQPGRNPSPGQQVFRWTPAHVESADTDEVSSPACDRSCRPG